MHQTIQILSRGATIQRAAARVGGLGPLALRLKVEERQLDYWMRDIGHPPDAVYFDVLDVIIDAAS